AGACSREDAPPPPPPPPNGGGGDRKPRGFFSGGGFGAIPPPILFQRAEIAGPPPHCRRDRLHPCRQRLPADRRLGARADLGRWPLTRPLASCAPSLCPAVLSGARRLRSVLPLEFHAGRVRHRSGVPLASHSQTPL